MSLLRHGSSFFQRRLTQLYTDTKSSCESVSAAARTSDDPELVELNQNFRTQKDRLLAWGLDWSDSNAAQPNDIDEALNEAGYTDVVASVMSSIQQLLNEAEKLQQPEESKSVKGHHSSDPASSPFPQVREVWTDQEIARSKDMLEELTAHIDTLYDLSRSRRNMSRSMTSKAKQSLGRGEKGLSRSRSAMSSKESFHSVASEPSKEMHEVVSGASIFGGRGPAAGDVRGPFDTSGSIQLAQLPFDQQSIIDSLSSTKEFYIDPAALHVSKSERYHTSNPPPYEAVAPSANSRDIGLLDTAAMPAALAATVTESSVPVLVEFSPILHEMQSSFVYPQRERLQRLSHTIQGLVENARVSHLGLLKFVGYSIDMTYHRYAFVYQIPPGIYSGHLLSVPEDASPCPLVSLFHSGDDRRDGPVPHLEHRFRLAYNLVLAVLHLRSQNIVHGNINSNNVLVFPKSYVENISPDSVADLRHPYLSSLAVIDSEERHQFPEPLSSSMYRHPDDRRVFADSSAWAYDLYSLGLVLLEIGLWTPISRLWKMKYNNAMFKSRIENVYVKKLGAKCGEAYLQIVQLCLDAPNFHLSTKPMGDLGLRIAQTYHYPWNDPDRSDEWDTFSRNFVYTICKILWRWCNADIVSPPPVEDMQESLPPPLSLEPDTAAFEQVRQCDLGLDGDHGDLSIQPTDDVVCIGNTKTLDGKVVGVEKRVRKRTLKKWNVDVAEKDLETWNLNVMPRLSKLLQKILRDSPESCSASIVIAGETAESAKPTICVTCTNVRRVRAALKKYFEYDRENWDLIVIRGDITRSKVPKRRRRKPKTQRNNHSDVVASSSQPNLNPFYQQKPVCGASIGAFRQDEHLPPVSYGGSILVDGMPYGMTVHHMLDLPFDGDVEEDDEAGEGAEEDFDVPSRSAGDWIPSADVSENEFAYSWCDGEPPEALYPLEISEGEEEDEDGPGLDESYQDYWLSDDYSSDEAEDDGDGAQDDDDAASVGDTAAIYPADDQHVIITQPAIDDVEEGFFPSLEDRDDEHLASHFLGYVHASSGVRRWTRNGIKHEVDWALIRIDDTRMDPRNLISNCLYPQRREADGPERNPSRKHGHQKSQPSTLNKVARLENLGGLPVQCCGRTSGFQRGRISKAMSLVKMHGRQSFSSSFTVDGDFGVPGDSGAWVFDTTGQVCGHVLAWSEKSRIAYIAPMQILFDDIARTLGAASVTLPDSQDTAASGASAYPFDHAMPARQDRSGHGFDPRQLPIGLGKLSLDLEEPIRAGANIRPNFKDISAAAYRVVGSFLPQQSRAMQHQLA